MAEKKQMNQLNTDQEYAATEFFKFMLSSDEKEFSISGPAGTGKTFLLQFLIDNILPQYENACKIANLPITINSVALTATTNKAADVLTAHFGTKAQTIHSFMNLKVFDDYETGKQKIRKKNNFCVHHNVLIIIDEASMINRELDLIIQEATHSSCKIVYVGDDKQLAPVGETVSVVFSRPMRRVQLLTPVRNSGQPALMNLCNQFRKTVETGIFKPIVLVPGVIDKLSDSEMQNHVNTTFIKEGSPSRILAYTNNQVIDYNNYIRSIRGYSDKLHVGEMVVNSTGVELTGQGPIPAEKEFIVTQVNTENMIVEVDGFKIESYLAEIKAIKDNSTFYIHQAVDKDFLAQVIKYFGKVQDWQNYFSLKNKYPDLRLRDSSTVYKAQGSTFDTVYIDLQNIGKSNMVNQVARMLYVAVSRPKHRIFLYGNLPSKYAG